MRCGWDEARRNWKKFVSILRCPSDVFRDKRGLKDDPDETRRSGRQSFEDGERALVLSCAE